MNAAPNLSRRRRQFVSKFIANGLNGTRAVLDCGITDNYASARTLAWRMLTRVDVNLAVEQALKAAKMDADEAVERLSDIARADIADVLEPDGSFDISKAHARGKSKLIKSLKFDKDSGKVVGLETYSAHEGARDIGKIHKLFVDKVETSDTSERDGAESAILQAIKDSAKISQITEENAAIGLFARMKDHETLGKAENWPVQFRGLLSKSADSEPETVSEASQ